MPSDRNPQPERDLESLLHENAALKEVIARLSRQVYGRVMPGLYAIPDGAKDADGAFLHENEFIRPGDRPGNNAGAFRETGAPYHIAAPTSTSVPADLPSEEVNLVLPSSKYQEMTVIAHESFEAIAARPAVIQRTICRTIYASGDGMTDAAPAPALFPDPSGGNVMFDASFVAHITVLRLAGIRFRMISELLKTESGLEISEESLRELVLTAAKTVAPVCTAMFTRTLPGWMNLRRMFEEAKTGGDWLADDFLKAIHALGELEENARLRAEHTGGAPEDLYRERRAARMRSARIVAGFFTLCRETLPSQNPKSPLAEAIRHALEHETVLSGFLYDPRMELFHANPETPVADPFAVLAVCADECRTRGVVFRDWLEETLKEQKKKDPRCPVR